MWSDSPSLVLEAAHRLRDLIAPRGCAGCDGAVAPGRALCPHCRERLDTAAPVTADAAFAEAPTAVAAGEYTTVLRQCLLAYKERNRRDLAGTLARLLARTLTVAGFAARPLLLVPIPATRRALRRRGFDHVGLLVRRLSLLLPDAAVARVLRCAPRPDSAELGRDARIRAATAALRIGSAGAARLRRVTTASPVFRVMLVDDIVTTGATLTAAAALLRNHGAAVSAAVTVAATSRYFPRKTGPVAGDIPGVKR